MRSARPPRGAPAPADAVPALAGPRGPEYLPRGPGGRRADPARGRRPGGRARAVAIGLLAAGCATLGPTGPPLPDPEAVARGAAGGGAAPASLRFSWAYSGRRGQVEGEGVARYNPPDSLRLDLFTSGDVALAVRLVGDSLLARGEIEEVELPSPPFLFAMAGLFRPPAPSPARGYVAGEDRVLVYGEATGDSVHYFVREGRLKRVEERGAGRVRRRLRLEWRKDEAWPRRAEYRDLVERNRVRWELRAVTDVAPHPPEIYDLSYR